MEDISRRQLIKLGLCTAAALSVPRAAWAASKAPAKELSFYHLHTGETLRVAYSEQGKYIPSAMEH